MGMNVTQDGIEWDPKILSRRIYGNKTKKERQQNLGSLAHNLRIVKVRTGYQRTETDRLFRSCNMLKQPVGT